MSNIFKGWIVQMIYDTGCPQIVIACWMESTFYFNMRANREWVRDKMHLTFCLVIPGSTRGRLGLRPDYIWNISLVYCLSCSIWSWIYLSSSWAGKSGVLKIWLQSKSSLKLVIMITIICVVMITIPCKTQQQLRSWWWRWWWTKLWKQMMSNKMNIILI